MKKALLTALLLTLFSLTTVQAQKPIMGCPLPDATIGRLGVTDMRLIAPPPLQTAANQMSLNVKQYQEAERTFRAYLQSNPSSKFAYIALCQLDPAFRETEFYQWRKNPSTDPKVLFRKGVSSYLHGLSYLAFNPARPKQSSDIGKYPEFGNLEKGPFATVTLLWSQEPELINGILLSAVRADISNAPSDPALLEQLISLAAGDRAARDYALARANKWQIEPTINSMKKTTAKLLVAALSNEISRQSEGAGGPNNTILDRKGQVKAVYSDAEDQWLFVQKGTELHYIGEWRRVLKKRFAIP